MTKDDPDVLHCISLEARIERLEAIVAGLTAERTDADESAVVELVKDVLSDASTDISQWLQLARRQRSESKDYSRDPLCATDRGIKDSEDVLGRIGAVFRAIHAMEQE